MRPIADQGLEDVAASLPEILWLSCDAMMVIDKHRRVVAMNSALERLIGHPKAEVVGRRSCHGLLSCQDLHGCPLASRPDECPGVRAIHELKPIQAAEFTVRAADGHRITISASYTPIRLLPGAPVWALVVLRDVTQQKQLEQELSRRAMTDPLTGLLNRTALFDACAKELNRASRHARPFAIAMIDIDQFKSYNDTHGHPAGDELLRRLAALLASGRRLTDLAARYGGDEFVFLFPETDRAGAALVAERVCRAVAQHPFPVPITISIGVAVHPEDGTTANALLAEADRRLYLAKERGGNTVVSLEG